MLHRSVALLVLLTSVATVPALAQSSGRFHLVSSVSGSRGAPDGGRFLMEDPRVTFQAGKDRQVLVLFEWQGPAGRHRCEGRWKDPSGRVVFTSESEVDARGPRFWVYWGLSLPDTVATGNWVLEALVDGEPASAHAFQILKEPPGPVGPPLRRTLPVAELYQRGLADTLTLEVLDATGAHLPATSGFFVTSELVSTSLAGINAARTVRIVTAGGTHLETSEIVGWNVREDWAMLRFPGGRGQPPMRAQQQPQVGDRGYFLESQGGGNRVIVETAFIGRSADGDLRVGAMANEETHGAPVFNEYGEVVAILVGSGIPGASGVALIGLDDGGYAGSRARPHGSVREVGATSRTLQDLDQAGVFVRPLTRTPHFVHGFLGTTVVPGDAMHRDIDRSHRFSRADRQCVVFSFWDPAQKEDTTSHFELHDRDNHRLGTTDPMKLRLRSGKSSTQYWAIPLAALEPGVYRIDLVLGAEPVWRTFFRLVE